MWPILNYVLLCLPGPQTRKAAAIENIAAVLEPDGVLFEGRCGAPRPIIHRQRGSSSESAAGEADSSLDDPEDGLREILEESFENVKVEAKHSVGYFIATGPR